jgi:DNA-binding transcriptional ArsR family regulator
VPARRLVALNRHSKLFRGLADPARLSLLLRVRTGKCSAGELARDCGLSPSNASNHLQCLLECGLVLVEPRGRQNVYRLADRQVLRLLDASARVLHSSAGALIDGCRNYGASRRALRRSWSLAKPASGVARVRQTTKPENGRTSSPARSRLRSKRADNRKL